MQAPSPPQLPVDPNLATEQTQAQQSLVSSLQTQSQGDMASLMARYGSMLAVGGATYGPMTMPPPTTAR